MKNLIFLILLGLMFCPQETKAKNWSKKTIKNVHTKVFISENFVHSTFENCTDLEFIRCNLAYTKFKDCAGLRFGKLNNMVNTVYPKDSIIEGSKPIEFSIEEKNGKMIKKVKCFDGKTRKYEMIESIDEKTNTTQGYKEKPKGLISVEITAEVPE